MYRFIKWNLGYRLALEIALVPLILFLNGVISNSTFAVAGMWWQPRTVLTIKEPIELSQQTRLEADEVHVLAPLITHGHSLTIIGRRVVFGGQGKISGFTKPAGDATEVPPQDAPPKPSAPGKFGKKGNSGKSGNPGHAGRGADGKNPPGEILIFASQFEGPPHIEAHGQMGGKGGTGGQGQNGSDGGKGADAIAANPCTLFYGTPAKTGLRGGDFGKGGKGGLGGKGGSPIPTKIFSALTPKEFHLATHTVGEPGKGGAPGVAGKPGISGKGGGGGAANTSSCTVPSIRSPYYYTYTNTEPAGALGVPGKNCICVNEMDTNCLCKASDATCIFNQCTEGNGEIGAVNPQTKLVPITRGFDDFEKRRFDVHKQWFEFHWWRWMDAVMRRSIKMLADLNNSETGAETIDEILNQEVVPETLVHLRRQWKTYFTDELEHFLKNTDADPVVRERWETALRLAKSFDSLLARVRPEEGIDKRLAERLIELFTLTRSHRQQALKLAATSCQNYTESVLKQEVFVKHLKNAPVHFLIPACEQRATFALDAMGAMKAIELVADMPTNIPEEMKGKIVISTIGPEPVVKPTPMPMQMPVLPKGALTAQTAPPPELEILLLSPQGQKPNSQQIPSLDQPAPVVFSELGLHKGYLNPEPLNTQLPSLAATLRTLARLGVSP